MKCRKQYYHTGELWMEIYHKEGDRDCFRRTDGPAYIYYYTSGEKECESYWQDSQRHRTDGPAQIKYSKNGEIIETEWWIEGKQIKPTNLMKMIWKRSQNEKD